MTQKELTIKLTKKTNSGLKTLGVKGKDVLKKINGEMITSKNINQEVIKSFDWKIGDKISLEIERNGIILTLEGKVINAQTEIVGLVIKDLPLEHPKVKLRNAWLKG